MTKLTFLLKSYFLPLEEMDKRHESNMKLVLENKGRYMFIHV
jgi:hypothetical protein